VNVLIAMGLALRRGRTTENSPLTTPSPTTSRRRVGVGRSRRSARGARLDVGQVPEAGRPSARPSTVDLPEPTWSGPFATVVVPA
jgi:hypothetical protein